MLFTDLLYFKQQFSYVEAVVKETLRLYPPAFIAVREVDSDKFYINGQKLPRGFSIFMHIRGLHRNEKFWPMANDFLP